ncbi:unnamed protein product [Oppiella nova]|uniref:Uncharacterized protein n=1 Tax=Oppiella nova TaxID=334625 RepID=A0A7R9QWQ4_9ACAR|nr:unnamed protein product [Oppiella nova]CAG2178380.1 unnamed protein product [Oppiella nova]
MGCRPAKLSKVAVITDSIAKYQNGNKVFIQNVNNSDTIEDLDTTEIENLENTNNSENSNNVLRTSSRREASRIAWRDTKETSKEAKNGRPIRNISPGLGLHETHSENTSSAIQVNNDTNG